MQKKRSTINGIIVVLIILIVGISLAYSYAYFTPIIIGNETNTEARLATGNLSVNFATTRYINASNLLPIDNNSRATLAEHTDFSVDNNGTLPVKYDIYLSSLAVSTNLRSADLCWELLQNNSVIASGNFASIGANTSLKLNSSVINLNSGTNNYIFRLWIKSTAADQNGLIGGTFGGKIKVVSTNQ